MPSRYVQNQFNCCMQSLSQWLLLHRIGQRHSMHSRMYYNQIVRIPNSCLYSYDKQSL